MPTFRLNESGTTLRVDANQDISNYTELSLVFTKPDGTSVTKTTADGVTLGAAAITDNDLGALEANTYVTYEIEAALLDTVGFWCVYFLYTNSASSPVDSWPGDPVEFEVEALTC